MNFDTEALENTASAGVTLSFTCPLRGIDHAPLLFLGRARAVLGAALLTIFHAAAVQCSADNMITDSGKILHTASANKHDGVFLKVVPDPRDVCRNFYSICQTDSGDLAKRRVRLLGSHCVNTRANSSALRIFLQRRSGRTRPLIVSPMPDELCYAWQIFPSLPLFQNIIPAPYRAKSQIICSCERNTVRGAEREISYQRIYSLSSKNFRKAYLASTLYNNHL